jgi:hypothetical protein
MSSREMNRARRKARRAVAKHRPRAGSGQDPGEHVRQDDIKHRPRASSGPDPRTVSGQDTGECLEKRIKLEDEGGGGEEGGVPDVDGTWGDVSMITFLSLIIKRFILRCIQKKNIRT